MVRLYIPDTLEPQAITPLNEDQVHYMRNVLRFSPGDPLTVFNGNEGEWQATIHTLTKSRGDITIIDQIRAPTPTSFVGLIFAPLKHDPLLYLIEKATELGVTCLQPTLMDRSAVTKFNPDKMTRNAIEASQQCERLEIPEIKPVLPLRDVLAYLHGYSDEIRIIVCQERGQPVFIGKTLKTIIKESPEKKIYLLIGPEGGLTPHELDLLASQSYTRFCNLGPNILRAETAAAYALTAYQVSVLNQN